MGLPAPFGLDFQALALTEARGQIRDLEAERDRLASERDNARALVIRLKEEKRRLALRAAFMERYADSLQLQRDAAIEVARKGTAPVDQGPEVGPKSDGQALLAALAAAGLALKVGSTA